LKSRLPIAIGVLKKTVLKTLADEPASTTVTTKLPDEIEKFGALLVVLVCGVMS